MATERKRKLPARRAPPLPPPTDDRSHRTADRRRESYSSGNWRWILGGLVALVIAAIVFAWLTFAQSAPSVEAPPPPLVEVVRARPAEQAMIEQTGFLRAMDDVAVTVEVSARIAEVSPAFARGALVDRGDLLLRLETRRLEADLARAEAAFERTEAQLAEARLTRARREELNDEEFASEARLEDAVVAVAQAQAALSAARADLVDAQARLADAVVRAPFDALVLEQDADPGDLASIGQSLGRVVGSAAAEVELGLTPGDLTLLGRAQTAVGSRVSVFAASKDGATPLGEGVVARVGPAIDPQSRTLNLIVRIPRPFDVDDGRRPLRVGELLLLRLPVDLARRGAVKLPRAALKADGVVWQVIPSGYDDGGHQERAMQQDSPSAATLRRRDVSVLARGPEHVVVTGDLTSGDLVLSSDLPAVDGAAVRAHEIDAAEGEASSARGPDARPGGA